MASVVSSKWATPDFMVSIEIAPNYQLDVGVCLSGLMYCLSDEMEGML
jgi:hypothetical protein